MLIRTVSIHNIRNIGSLHLSPSSDCTVILGENGAGKTSILEAISMIAGDKKLIRGKKGNIIQDSKLKAVIKGAFEKKESIEEDIVLKLNKTSGRIKSEYTLNGKKASIKKLSQEISLLSFSNNDLRLLHGAPSRRRAYLDDLAQILYPQLYYREQKRYEKALLQRNRLLNQIYILQKRKKDEELEFWTEELLDSGSWLTHYRHMVTKGLEEKLQELESLLKTKKLQLQYHSRIRANNAESKDNIAQKYRKQINSNNSKEQIQGYTSIGPHQDDLVVSYQHNRVVDVFSRGEQRKTIIALKLCERDMLVGARKERPVVLLDDVLFELDHNNKELIAAIFSDDQTIYTGTEEDHFPREIIKKAQLKNISGGTLVV